jgi:hypothetical protein
MWATLREQADCILVYVLAAGVWATIVWLIVDKL